MKCKQHSPKLEWYGFSCVPPYIDFDGFKLLSADRYVLRANDLLILSASYPSTGTIRRRGTSASPTYCDCIISLRYYTIKICRRRAFSPFFESWNIVFTIFTSTAIRSRHKDRENYVPSLLLVQQSMCWR